MWVEGGMVATLILGDSTLSIQQSVEDAGFHNVVVMPMCSDRVFIHCTGGEDIWKVFNDALDFFGMLFYEVHKWESKDEQYERGAWIRIYGTPAHAWNESFFKICVSKCGRFVRSDKCTVDRARLDFARVLISTTSIEVINSIIEVVVDRRLYLLKFVEE